MIIDKSGNKFTEGMRFGYLTVIDCNEDEISSYKKAHPDIRGLVIKCRCDCGTEKFIRKHHLLSGGTKSCGCMKSKMFKEAIRIDLANKNIGNLTVLEIDNSKESRSGKHAYWICKCNICGNLVSVRSSDLISGIKTDCGCEKYNRMSKAFRTELSGKKFGHLEVSDKTVKRNEHIYWVCRCDICGGYEEVRTDMLLHYGKDRCKLCMGISQGEKKIYELLTENDIDFVHDKTYLHTNKRFRFDFRVTQESDCDYVIEFDGKQHYEHIPFFGDISSFESQKKRDSEKNEWCVNNGIPIIRIPYTALNNISIDDLIPKTSEYLVG